MNNRTWKQTLLRQIRKYYILTS